MIKIDENYTDYCITDDPGYPGGKAVDSSTSQSKDGTPYKEKWMNDINGFYQALIVEGLGEFIVNGEPDKVGASDKLNALKALINKLAANVDLENIVQQDNGRIDILWDALFTNITTNPFTITFDTLDDVMVTHGVWNVPLKRLEC
jgi:RNAse (barnase) inhibitor barstar